MQGATITGRSDPPCACASAPDVGVESCNSWVVPARDVALVDACSGTHTFLARLCMRALPLWS